MQVAYAAAKRGPPVGQIRTAATQDASPARASSRAAAPGEIRRRSRWPSVGAAFAIGNACWPIAAVSLPYGNARLSVESLLGARAPAPLARDRCACSAGGVAGLHPVAADHPARPVPFRARPGRPPAALRPRASTSPTPCRNGPAEIKKTLFNSSTIRDAKTLFKSSTIVGVIS